MAESESLRTVSSESTQAVVGITLFSDGGLEEGLESRENEERRRLHVMEREKQAIDCNERG